MHLANAQQRAPPVGPRFASISSKGQLMATKTDKPADTKRAAVPAGAVASAIATAAGPALLPGPSREEAVRRLAYSYYEQRGCSDGSDLDDWLRAEAALASGGIEP
jgi:hypothetical protein